LIYPLARAALFRLDPELAHDLSLKSLRAFRLAAGLAACRSGPDESRTVMGLEFPNPVGLAAGMDKNGEYIDALAALGFGFLEVGTVTPRPQPGNPRPRLFRLVEDQGVINRMGFPGKGADYAARSLRAAQRRPDGGPGASDPHAGEGLASPASQARYDTLVGVNLGKNKDTPLESAAEDYVSLMSALSPLADYLAVNVSSPNTVGLRRLQGREMLESLLGQMAAARRSLPIARPVLVKLAPDLSDEELDDALAAILATGMDGIIVTNTTLERAGLRSPDREETGGLSGAPLRVRSEAVLARVLKQLGGRLPVVSAGGIMGPEDAKRRLEMGAALVQVYTGLVYAGPGLVKEIVREL